MLFFNLNLKLAEKTMWGKFQKALQKSPWFMERGLVSGRTNKIYQPNKDVKLDIGSTEEHALSVAVMFCLEGNTEILTDKGYFKIKDLKDKKVKVYTQNENKTISLTDREVEIKETKLVNRLYKIILENDISFKCTEDHKIKMHGNTYVEAKYLTEGMWLMFTKLDSTYINIKVKNVEIEDYREPVPVYDVIDVPVNHNFLIRGDTIGIYNLVVHNCGIDEMSFGDNDNVDYLQAGMMQIYNQLYLRLSSRFSKAGRIQGRMYLISSAKSTNAVLESFIRDNEGQPRYACIAL